MYCLPKDLANKLRKKLKSGEINPEKLIDMIPKERHEYFAGFLGEFDATQVNALFESKLLLENQQRGILNWAKQTAGMKEKPMRDIIARVNKMEELLTPATEDLFYEDLVGHKLGVSVTMEEAANIVRLAKEVETRKPYIEGGKKFGKQITDEQMQYGLAQANFKNYFDGLKSEATEPTLTERLHPSMYGKDIVDLAGISKSAVSTLDNTSILRQGVKVLATHPTVWARNSLKTFTDIWHTLAGKGVDVKNVIQADIFSRENFVNGKYKKDKLAVGVVEEAFPKSEALEKIPVIGSRVHRAAENAFTGFMYRNRADLYDLYTRMAEKAGFKETTGIGIGKLANSLGSRGSLGRLEPIADVVNPVFFSIRNLKANIDVLTAHTFSKDMSLWAKKQAAINLVKIIGFNAAVLVIADAVKPKCVEWNMTSSDVGKIKEGHTRFDVTGGLGSIAVLAARLVTGKKKSSTTGIKTEIGKDYGAGTKLDLVFDFFENKLSPAAGVLRDIMRGRTFSGEKPTITNEALGLVTPMVVQTGIELWKDPKSADKLLSLMADALGIGVNTYGFKENWDMKTSEEMNSFRKGIGEKKFKQANEEYNKIVGDWVDRAVKHKDYKKLSDKEKRDQVRKKKETVKKYIFNKYSAQNPFIFQGE